jgi:hypothetical protein
MLTVLGQTEEVGASTSAQLVQQREQMSRITEEVEGISSLLDRGGKLLRVSSHRQPVCVPVRACVCVCAHVCVIARAAATLEMAIAAGVW